MQMLAAALALASSHAFVALRSTVRAPSTRLSSSVWYDAQPQRRALIAGNWKLNPSTAQDADALLALLASNVRTMATPPEIVIFPPMPYLQRALDAVDGTGIAVGAQDISLEESGAFTGEVAASMVRSLGCDWALVGHSERRTLYDEGDDVCNQKVLRCLAQDGLKVILCAASRAAIKFQASRRCRGVQGYLYMDAAPLSTYAALAMRRRTSDLGSHSASWTPAAPASAGAAAKRPGGTEDGRSPPRRRGSMLEPRPS